MPLMTGSGDDDSHCIATPFNLGSTDSLAELIECIGGTGYD